MNYNDESLIQNYEKLAKEYNNSLQKKGFVFVRFNSEDETKKSVIKKLSANFLILKNGYTTLPYAKKSLLPLFQKIKELTSVQMMELEENYEFLKDEPSFTKGFQKINSNNIFSFEATQIKDLFQLFLLEDDQEKQSFIKRAINSRLTLLSKL